MADFDEFFVVVFDDYLDMLYMDASLIFLMVVTKKSIKWLKREQF